MKVTQKKKSLRQTQLDFIEQYLAQPQWKTHIPNLREDPDSEEVFETLRTQLPTMIDGLADGLAGQVKISSSKATALRRVEPLLERALGITLDLRDESDVERRERRQLNLNTGAHTMKTKKEVAVKSTGFNVKKPVTAPTKKSTTPTKTAITDIISKPLTKMVGGFKPDAKITVIAKENPRRPGTHGHKIFESYKKLKTVSAVLAAGGKIADIKWDIEHDSIKVS